MKHYGERFWVVREVNGDTPTRWWHGVIGALGITAVIVWLIVGGVA